MPLMTMSTAVITVLHSAEAVNYNALNLITTVLDSNVYDRVSHLELFMMSGLNYATTMRALLRLSFHKKYLQ
jgi:hypothetical protein